MLDHQENKISMYEAVITNLQKNKDIWNGTPYFASNVAAFLALVENIYEVAGVQTEDNTGAKEDKQYRRDDLEESAMLVVNIIYSYASAIKNKVLQELMYYTPSSLKKSAGNDLLVDTNVIHSLGKEHLSGAGGYGLNQAMLDDLLAKNAEFLKHINTPSDLRTIKKDATAELKKLFDEADTLLKNNIDRDIFIFKTLHYVFYRSYFICRKIKDTPKTKLAMRIKIVDAVTKEPIPKALVVIKDHEIKRKSSPLGAMRILHLKEGNHTVNVSMNGYVTQAVKAKYTAGETTVVKVEMVANG